MGIQPIPQPSTSPGISGLIGKRSFNGAGLSVAVHDDEFVPINPHLGPEIAAITKRNGGRVRRVNSHCS